MSYEQYNDSGIDWIGVIPSHWGVTRLKHALADILGGGTPTTSNNSYWDDDGIPWVNISDMSAQACITDTERRISAEGRDSKSLPILPKGTLLISIFASLGKFSELGIDATVNQAILGLIPGRDLSKSFLRYYLSFIEQYISYYSSSNTQQNLNLTKVKNLHIPLPPHDEQFQIGTYLDKQTKQIDDLIHRKKRLIELLKEQRVSLINHAVTKGLNPDAEMKDSGVEWIGEVPAHWERSRLKYATSAIIDAEHKTAPYDADGKYLVVRTSNVRDGKLVLNDAKFTNEAGFQEWTRRGTPRHGDVLLTREAPAGEACAVPEDHPLCLGQRMVLIRPTSDVLDQRYLVRCFYSDLTTGYIRTNSYGSTVDHLNMSEIRDLPLFLPPIQEQREIADHVQIKADEIGAVIRREQQLTRLLIRYRTSLISEVVTGKIDVRDKIPEPASAEA